MVYYDWSTCRVEPKILKKRLKIMKIPTTLDRKARKKWLTCPAPAIVLALLLVLSSLPVYAGEQQAEQTETPTVTQDAGSASAQSAASSEQNEPLADYNRYDH